MVMAHKYICNTAVSKPFIIKWMLKRISYTRLMYVYVCESIWFNTHTVHAVMYVLPPNEFNPIVTYE